MVIGNLCQCCKSKLLEITPMLHSWGLGSCSWLPLAIFYYVQIKNQVLVSVLSSWLQWSFTCSRHALIFINGKTVTARTVCQCHINTASLVVFHIATKMERVTALLSYFRLWTFSWDILLYVCTATLVHSGDRSIRLCALTSHVIAKMHRKRATCKRLNHSCTDQSLVKQSICFQP